MAADDCTVALCVPVSVAKQRRLDLIDELQLRGSSVFCKSIPGICRAQQRACQHPPPNRKSHRLHCAYLSLSNDMNTEDGVCGERGEMREEGWWWWFGHPCNEHVSVDMNAQCT